MVELRKGKQSAEECTALLKKSNYFGTMLVKMGKADCLLGGATYSTADTIRPALQLVKTKKGAHLVSSCFILDRDCGEEGLKRIAMGDCAVNIDYTDTIDKATGEVKVSAASKLAEVAVETAKTAKLFGIDPKVAVLSFSTKAPARAAPSLWSHDATIKASGDGTPSWLWTASCSLTLPLLPKLHRSSARAARSLARPTPSSSPASRPATSAIRSLSVWAATLPTAPFCRA